MFSKSHEISSSKNHHREIGVATMGIFAFFLAACAPAIPAPKVTLSPAAESAIKPLDSIEIDCSNALTNNDFMTRTLAIGDVFWLQKGENLARQELGVKLTYEGNDVLNHEFTKYLPLGIRPHVDFKQLDNHSSKYTIHSDRFGDKVFTTTIKSGVLEVSFACER